MWCTVVEIQKFSFRKVECKSKNNNSSYLFIYIFVSHTKNESCKHKCGNLPTVVYNYFADVSSKVEESKLASNK